MYGERLKHCMEVNMTEDIKDKVGSRKELSLDLTQLVMRML